MKKVWLMLAMLVCIFASCSDGGSDNPVNPTPKPEDVKTEITIDSGIISNGLSFDTATGEQSVSFSVNANWTLSIASTTSGATWCKASATSGSKGSATVKFSVDENTDYEDRSVSVTIKAGTVSKTFTITQKGADALLVTAAKYEVAQEGGQIEVEVKANIDYQLEISETAKDWITETKSKSRSLTTYKHQFEVALNEDTEKREGEIVFKSGDKVETLTVYQAGGAIILLSQNEYTVSDAGETISVDIKSNVEYGVQMPDVDWISDEASSRGMSSHTLKYVIAANDGYDSRSAEIIFYDKNSDLKDTLRVIQAQKDAIVISQKTYNVKAEGETIEVKLSANVDFEVTMPDVDWIKQTDSRALKEHTFYFEVVKNEGEDSRSAEIVFVNKESQLSETITISQDCKSLLAIAQNEYNVDDAGETISVAIRNNIEYAIQMSDVDWITEATSNRSISTDTLKFVIAANDEYDSRSAEIIFFDKNSDLKDTLKVIQAQKDAIVISQKTYDVKAAGETIEVKLSANVDFEITMSDVNWIAQTESRGLTEHVLYFKVSKNESKEKRSAEIIFKDKNSQASDKLTINQFGVLEEGYANGVVTVATAGTMKKLLGDDYLNITSLKIIGFINGDDVYYLRKMLGGTNFNKADWGKLTTLDLSESTIVEGGEWYYDTETLQFYTANNIIGDYMFYACENLQEIILPSNVVTIGKSALSNCKKMISTTIGNCTKLINEEAFKGSALGLIEIPNSVTEIGYSAFSECNNLTTLSIKGNGSTKIGTYAFCNCKTLTHVVIGNGVVSLGSGVFEGCYKLKEVTIGNGISIIPTNMFKNCHQLKIITFGKGVKKFEDCVFGYDPENYFLEAIHIQDLAAWCEIDCSHSFSQPFARGYANLYINNELLTELTIPQGVTKVGDIFVGCKSINKVIIPEGVVSVGSFSECKSLTSIEISNTVTSVGNLNDCKLLNNIIIPNSVTSIGTFYNCESLTEAKLGSGIVSIPDRMFDKCKSLKKVIIGDNVDNIGKSSFAETNIMEFYSYTKNPPKLEYDGTSSALHSMSFASFPNISSEAKLYVPSRCGTEYKKSIWGTIKGYADYFENIIEMEE